MARALSGAGIPAAWADIRPIMVTDDRFGRATPYVQVVNTRARDCLRPLLDDELVPVTQGFIGATPDGVPTTLGRGGSDFTAALLGAALGATRVEIWTDVNGLMTADPSIVPSARTLAAASYEEAAELATFGAKVLHPATAMPLVRAGIPIVVLNSTRPELPGTTIEPSAELERMGDSPIRSISWKRGITVINVRAPRMLGAYGFLRAMFEVFERHEVVVDVLASGEVSVSLTVEDRSRIEAVVRELSELGEVWTDDARAIVSVVGIGLRNTPGLASRIFASGAAGQRRSDLARRVGDQHDVRGPGGGWARRGAAAACGVLRDRLSRDETFDTDVIPSGARDDHDDSTGDPMRLAIVGNGRMGRAVVELAAERGHVVHAVIGHEENPEGAALSRRRLEGVDAAIEFTRPDAVVAQPRAT